ncbi:MAG: hypothetical protein GDA67_09855 [Nitrospira sp. CR1.3]|nr:hypothetical protein [Nitrospira sp. CR1.3]
MLKVVTGRFHPHLESALVDHIIRIKAGDPFAAIAILAPSAPLLDRVRRLLAIERQLALLNVHFLTFHQLALRLADERRGQAQPVPVRIVDDLFFEQLVRQLVRNRLSDLTALQHLGHSSGTWGALWSTIRDLKDAAVDPAAALRGLVEGCFDREDTDWLRALFALHAAVKEVGATLEVGTADDLAESLLPSVSTSSFLASLRQVLYYGFYDLTQVQLSLFEAVSATAPTTLFFPLEEGTSFDFARRFFDRHIRRLVTTPSALTRPSDFNQSAVASPALTIRSVIGLEEELASTCRTILDLVETNGYRFDEIGVVARTLDPYRSSLQPVFDRHRIPFTTTAGRLLIHEPLCKILIQLATLPADNFYRATVLDVVSSPLYVTALDHERSPHYRPEQWKLIVPALQITHGLDEWARLERAGRSALQLEGENEESGPALDLDIAPDAIGLLWQVVSPLLEACAALPQRGTFGQLLEAFRPLVTRHLRRPASVEAAGQDPHVARLASTWDTIDRIWTTLGELDALAEEVSWTEFVELLTHALERATMPQEAARYQGVSVLDAMAARGLPFKALFVLGLNEKVFPRYIREDAFLRDRHRLVLDATLGFKIDEKLSGYDEEALLFSLLRQAAVSRLYLSFQRADEAGRMLVPSPYLSETAFRSDVEKPLPEIVPRRLTDRIAQRPAARMFLPPADLAQWMALNSQDPAGLLRSVGGEADLFRHAAEALDRIEDDQALLTPFDGLTGPLESHWSRLLQRGMAPTPLERYARCPFQYFAADVLRLEPIRLPTTQEPDALLLGTLCHGALRRYYEQGLSPWQAMDPAMEDSNTRRIEIAVEQAARDCESRHRTGLYLLWELAKAQMVDLIGAAVDDERARESDQFIPIAFEVEAEGTVPIPANGNKLPLKVHGRVDRIDRHRESGALRIIDYKFKTGAKMKTDDRNLLQSAARGSRLQPPLYAGLDLPDLGTPRQVQFLFLAPNWPSPIARSTFDADAWVSEAGSLIRNTIALLLDGVQNGRFYIVPDSYCKTCPYRVVCRREHAPTRWRAHRAAEPKQLAALRAIRIKDA